MKHLNLFSFLIFFLICTFATATATAKDSSASLSDKCSQDLTKVVACLGFATGKESTPTKECCQSAEEIKGKDPVCLCFLMEQTLNGSDTVKSMGIQSDRLLQLPTACKLTNASVSDCPKLLGISPSSPEYKIFTNVSSPSSPSSTSSTGASLPMSDPKNNGPKFGPQISGPISFALSIFFFYFMFM